MVRRAGERTEFCGIVPRRRLMRPSPRTDAERHLSHACAAAGALLVAPGAPHSRCQLASPAWIAARWDGSRSRVRARRQLSDVLVVWAAPGRGSRSLAYCARVRTRPVLARLARAGRPLAA